MFNIEEALAKVPTKPGVYLMKDSVGTIIYVGKAKNLRNRLRQYFQDNVTNYKVKVMVENIKEFEYIIVDNEVESLILEQNLIKENMPKYNILLKDDKQYPYIKITNERFPRVLRTRSPKEDGAKYYGPFTEALAVNTGIEFFNSYFKLRTCGLNLNKPNPRYKVCLNYHIDKCYGPCEDLIDEEDYNKSIKKIEDFLEGRNKSMIRLTKDLMAEAAENLEFEKAADYRNLTEILESLLTKQSVETLSIVDKDMIGIARYEDEVAVQIFFVRGGKVLGREHYILEDSLNSSDEDVIESFLTQYYAGYTRMPGEIYIQKELEDKEMVERFLSDLKGSNVRIIVPKRGENLDLLRLVEKNAKDMLNKYGRRFIAERKSDIETLNELQSLIDLPTFPKRIEAYDVSHIAGDQSSGAMVVFEDGQSKRSDYRKFRITTATNDDYKSMEEMLTRRLRRLVKDSTSNESFDLEPDLIVVDGGKGQINVALKVIGEFKLDIPVMGLVKDDFHQTRGIIYEDIEYIIDVDTDLYRLIYRIQEEAHRFAINYHRTRMSNRIYQSELNNISGVGPKRRRDLISHFKSIERIKLATEEELLQVPSMNRPTAKAIVDYFKGE